MQKLGTNHGAGEVSIIERARDGSKAGHQITALKRPCKDAAQHAVQILYGVRGESRCGFLQKSDGSERRPLFVTAHTVWIQRFQKPMAWSRFKLFCAHGFLKTTTHASF